MKEFILTALPFVAFAIVLAIIFSQNKPKTIKIPAEGAENLQDKNKDNAPEETYQSLGIAIGTCLGIAFSLIFTHKYGPNALTFGICFGMLIGMLCGGCIKKK